MNTQRTHPSFSWNRCHSGCFLCLCAEEENQKGGRHQSLSHSSSGATVRLCSNGNRWDPRTPPITPLPSPLSLPASVRGGRVHKPEAGPKPTSTLATGKVRKTHLCPHDAVSVGLRAFSGLSGAAAAAAAAEASCCGAVEGGVRAGTLLCDGEHLLTGFGIVFNF